MARPQSHPSPLHGKRIVVTRTRQQASKLVAQLEKLGAIPIEIPTIHIEPVVDTAQFDTAVHTLHTYDWLVLTSPNGVAQLAARMAALGIPAATINQCTRVAAVGPATAKALAKQQINTDFIPTQYIGTTLANELPITPNARILLPRAKLGRPDIVEILTSRGALVTDIPTYTTVPAPLSTESLQTLHEGVDIVTFTSASTAENFAKLLDSRATTLLAHCTVACIGPITAERAESLGFHVSIVAQTHTIAGLVSAIVAEVQKTPANP